MIGDSAGLIHPLCGNGMAMAIHSAKLFSELFLKQHTYKNIERNQFENEYKKQWNKTFSNRLKTGRFVQKLLMNEATANFGFTLLNQFPSMLNAIITKTHGKPLNNA